MRELMELSGASQAQIERWQKRGFLSRLPRSFAGGGGSQSTLNEEIVERARLLADHARQGTLTLSPISLIATLAEPDVALLREAVIANLTALHRRLGMDVHAATPQEVAMSRLGAAERKARREGRTWSLRDIATGPVREGSLLPLAELVSLFNRDTDEEIGAEDLEAAVDVVVRGLKVTGPGLEDGVPISSLLPGTEAELRAEVRRLLTSAPTFRGQCELVRSAPSEQLIRACRVVPLARRLQVVAVNSAVIAHARHAGVLTPEMFSGWHDLGMSHTDLQRMTAHPMWARWGKMLAGGGVHDSGDGQRIAVCLESPAILDELETYSGFLVTLVPEPALHRLSSRPLAPGDLTVK
jgi:hypothetical protein